MSIAYVATVNRGFAVFFGTGDGRNRSGRSVRPGDAKHDAVLAALDAGATIVHVTRPMLVDYRIKKRLRRHPETKIAFARVHPCALRMAYKASLDR